MGGAPSEISLMAIVGAVLGRRTCVLGYTVAVLWVSFYAPSGLVVTWSRRRWCSISIQGEGNFRAG